MWLPAVLLLAPAMVAGNALFPRGDVTKNDVENFTYMRTVKLPIMNGFVQGSKTNDFTTPDAYWQIVGSERLGTQNSSDFLEDSAQAYFTTVGVDRIKTPRLVFQYPGGPMYFGGNVTGVDQGARLGVIEYYAPERREIPVVYQPALADVGYVLKVTGADLAGTTTAAFILDATFAGTMEITHFDFKTNITSQTTNNQTLVPSDTIQFVNGTRVTSDRRIHYQGGNWTIAQVRAPKTLRFLQGKLNETDNGTGSPTIQIDVPPNTAAIQFNGGLGRGAAPKTIHFKVKGDSSQTTDEWTLPGGVDGTTFGDGVQLFATLDPTLEYEAVMNMDDGVLLTSVDFFSFFNNGTGTTKSPASDGTGTTKTPGDDSTPTTKSPASDGTGTTKPPASGSATTTTLSSGIIAGIVIGGVLGLVLLALAVGFCVRKRRQKIRSLQLGSNDDLRNLTDHESELQTMAGSSPARREMASSGTVVPAIHREMIDDTASESHSQYFRSPWGTPQGHIIISPMSGTSSDTPVDRAVLSSSKACVTTSSRTPEGRRLPPSPGLAVHEPNTPVTVEQDAGHLRPMRVLPPTYNPDWERQHRAREFDDDEEEWSYVTSDSSTMPPRSDYNSIAPRSDYNSTAPSSDYNSSAPPSNYNYDRKLPPT